MAAIVPTRVNDFDRKLKFNRCSAKGTVADYEIIVPPKEPVFSLHNLERYTEGVGSRPVFVYLDAHVTLPKNASLQVRIIQILYSPESAPKDTCLFLQDECPGGLVMDSFHCHYYKISTTEPEMICSRKSMLPVSTFGAEWPNSILLII